MKCSTVKCESEAAVIVHWPGADKAFCVPCALRAEGVARAMGFRLSATPIGGPSDEQTPPTEDDRQLQERIGRK